MNKELWQYATIIKVFHRRTSNTWPTKTRIEKCRLNIIKAGSSNNNEIINCK